MGRATVALLMLAAAAGWLAAQSEPPRAPTREVPRPAAPTDEPSITMEGFKTEVTSRGKLQQRIEAEWGRMDERENSIELRNLRLIFYDQGEFRGEARCGGGLLWLAARPTENIGANDVLLTNDVTYRSRDGEWIQTPSMRYVNASRSLSSSAGYIHQYRAGERFWIERGAGFEIKLLSDQGMVESYRGFSPVFELSDTPAIIP
jgi:hypothetical protein